MALQSLPPAATEYARDQRHAASETLGAMREQWRRIGTDFDRGWALVAPTVQQILDTAQSRTVDAAVAWVPAVLEDTGQPVRRADYMLNRRSLVGTAGDGLGTDTLAYEAIVTAKSAVGRGATPYQALASGWAFLKTAVPTLLSDTGRTAEKVTAVGRGSRTFVRMLTPPSCGRCVILAGQTTHADTAFLRHPKCDCRNIPAVESVASDLTVNPGEYLDQLDDKGLARALGSQANAQAYRDGADLNQLVNAYRRSGAVRPAQMAMGRTVKVTTEGTTRRGAAYRRMKAAGLVGNGTDVRIAGERYFRAGRQQARLMPESIYQVARSDAEAQNLLRVYGWIL